MKRLASTVAQYLLYRNTEKIQRFTAAEAVKRLMHELLLHRTALNVVASLHILPAEQIKQNIAVRNVIA
jgi:hypothetical protein